MRPKPPTPDSPAIRSVSADEVLSLREFGRRLGLRNRILCDCQRKGLRTILVGRTKYIVGSDALDWFKQQGQQQAGGQQ
jgi:hypothetical protein